MVVSLNHLNWIDALKVLDEDGPQPTQALNSGVVGKLCGEGLAKLTRGRSPYKKHKGEMISYTEITEDGGLAVEELKG